MSRPQAGAIRRIPRGFPLLLAAFALITGCGDGPSFRVLEVTGDSLEWGSLSLYGLVFSTSEGGETARIPLRKGDLVGLGEDGNVGLFLPVHPSEGESLDLRLSDPVITLSGEPVMLVLERDENKGWEWLRNATAEDVSALRMIVLDTDLPPERTGLVEKLALHNPAVGVAVEDEDALNALLRDLDPEILHLLDAPIGEEHKALLAGEPNLRTLLIPGDHIGGLEFLRGIPKLETVFLAGWDYDEVGPFPDSIPSLRSVVLMLAQVGNLDGLGIQPSLEDLTIFMCEGEEESGALDISVLRKHPRLEMVSFRACPVKDLSALAALEDLTWLGLPWGATQEQLESVVRTHPDLTVLEIIDSDESGISDLTPLQDLTKLEGLLIGTKAPVDPLFEMDHLEYLAVVVGSDVVPSFNQETFTRLKAELPETVVTRVDPVQFCLGSGFILLLVPMVVLAWTWSGRRRRPACRVSRDG
jgi:hypothetical protein